MAVHERRARTNEILDRLEDERALSDSEGLEALLTETIRLLRENKTECVRSEHREAERIGGQRWAESTSVNLGYGEAKAEIDAAVAELLEEKSELRSLHAARPKVVGVSPDRDVNGQLSRLTDLHELGILTAAEFAAAKDRLS